MTNMKLKLALLITLLATARFACASATQSQADLGVLSFSESQGTPRSNDREEELYSGATEIRGPQRAPGLGVVGW